MAQSQYLFDVCRYDSNNGTNCIGSKCDEDKVFGSIAGVQYSWLRFFGNVPAMIPSTVVNYGALVNSIPANSIYFDSDADGRR